MELTQHPLSAAFPSMSADDFQALKDDIEIHGQREPITVYDGMVLDGWHRYRACVDLGITPTQFKFGDADPVAFVQSQNLHRRHLTASQRAAAVVACFGWVKPGTNQHTKTGVATVATPPKTNAQKAAIAGVAERMVTDAETVKKAGFLEPVIEGAMTVTEAAKVVRGTPSKPKAKPEVAPESFAPDAAELAANAAEELAYLESMEKIIESDDKLAAAAAEIKRLTALVKVLESRNTGLMEEKNAAIRAAKSWQRKYDEAARAAA